MVHLFSRSRRNVRSFLALALVAYVVRKIGPCSFRFHVALARIISFKVEMESWGQDAGMFGSAMAGEFRKRS